MKSFMFLISLYGKNIVNGKMPIGVANTSDRNIIARFVYSKYDLALKEQTSNTCYYKTGIHYEYTTNDDKVFVHVDAIDKID